MGPGTKYITNTAEPGVVQPHPHLAVARWKPFQGWVAGPCANLFIANYFLTHKVHTSLTEDPHQTDDTAGIPHYILLSLPSILLFSRWKHVEYEWTTNAAHTAGCVRGGNGYLPAGRSTQAGSTTTGLQIRAPMFLWSKVVIIIKRLFFFFPLKWFY